MVAIREARRKEGVHELELGILKDIQKEMGLEKCKDNKRKAPSVASFTSEDEPLIPVCCKSDDKLFNNEDLPKKKLTPFFGKYREFGKEKEVAPGKKKEEDNDTDDEGGKKKTGEDDSEEEGDKQSEEEDKD
jgi:hypothetical protein